MLSSKHLDFLLDESDPVQIYEAKAPTQQSSQYDQGMEALSRLNRVQQVEALHGKSAESVKFLFGRILLFCTTAKVVCFQFKSFPKSRFACRISQIWSWFPYRATSN